MSNHYSSSSFSKKTYKSLSESSEESENTTLLRHSNGYSSTNVIRKRGAPPDYASDNSNFNDNHPTSPSLLSKNSSSSNSRTSSSAPINPSNQQSSRRRQNNSNFCSSLSVKNCCLKLIALPFVILLCVFILLLPQNYLSSESVPLPDSKNNNLNSNADLPDCAGLSETEARNGVKCRSNSSLQDKQNFDNKFPTEASSESNISNSSKIRPIMSSNIIKKHAFKQVWEQSQFVLPISDKRAYRGLKLTNDLTALVISDPTTDRSAAALDVHVGYLQDPEKLPGLAHFLEHMLFMGTEKYPGEDDYQDYVTGKGGYTNAYTDTDHTNYYFEITPDGLAGGLDRFAQFFYRPLMSAESTEREVNAIESENSKNLKEDNWRQHQLFKSLAKPDLPYNKFGTGNKNTLWDQPKSEGIDTREALLKFHRENYSSNNMKLVVIGKESLDELTDQVANLFILPENKNLKPAFYGPQYEKEALGKLLYTIPIKNSRSVQIQFPVPDLSQTFPNSDPSDTLIAHLIGHEGPGSLLSELKRRGWSNSLVAGTYNAARGISFFQINLDLTETGLVDFKQVVKLVFQYIELIRKNLPLESWMWEEAKKYKDIQFRFQEQSSQTANFVSQLARRMQEEIYDDKLFEIRHGPYHIEDYKPELVQQMLDLFTVDNSFILVTAKEFEKNWPEADLEQKKEKWYETTFGIRYFTEEEKMMFTIDKNELSEKLHLPPRNLYIPDNFKLFPGENQSVKGNFLEEINRPVMIKRNDNIRALFKQDDGTFSTPKAQLKILLSSGRTGLDPLTSIRFSMLQYLVNDALQEISYDATIAGLSYSVKTMRNTMAISVSGFNQKAPKMLDTILEKVTKFEANAERHRDIKEGLIRSYKSDSAKQPYQHCLNWVSHVINAKTITNEEFLKFFESEDNERLTGPHAITHFLKSNFLTRLAVEILVTGNVNATEAKVVVEKVDNWVKQNNVSKILTKSEIDVNRQIVLPGLVRVIRKNSVHPNNAVELWYQTGENSLENKSISNIFIELVKEKAFDQLRTKQQLGYIVNCGYHVVGGVHGVRLLVQSEKDPLYLEYVIRKFWEENAREYLNELTDEKFNEHVQSYIKQLLEKPKNLAADTNTVWVQMTNNRYNFESMPEMADYIKNNITKAMILEFFNDRIINNNQTLSVHVLGAANETPLTQDGLKEAILEEMKPKDETDKSGTELEAEKKVDDTKNDGIVVNESYLKHISGYKEYRTLSEIRDMKKSCYLYPAQVPNARDQELLFSRIIE